MLKNEKSGLISRNLMTKYGRAVKSKTGDPALDSIFDDFRKLVILHRLHMVTPGKINKEAFQALSTPIKIALKEKFALLCDEDNLNKACDIYSNAKIRLKKAVYADKEINKGKHGPHTQKILIDNIETLCNKNLQDCMESIERRKDYDEIPSYKSAAVGAR